MASFYHNPDLEGDGSNGTPEEVDGFELDESAAQLLRDFKQQIDDLNEFIVKEEVQRGLNKAAFGLEPVDEVCCLGGWYGMWAFKVYLPSHGWDESGRGS